MRHALCALVLTHPNPAESVGRARAELQWDAQELAKVA